MCLSRSRLFQFFALSASLLLANLQAGIARAGSATEDPGVSDSTSEVMHTERKVSDEQAKAIARQAIAGEVFDVQVERKLGKETLVVELISDSDSAEIDVIIDMVSGEVLGIEN
jgi:uncharacterized membrane protein YkoI